MFLIGLFVLLNDWTDMISDSWVGALIGTKVAFSIFVAVLGVYVLKNTREVNTQVMERLYGEKKHLSKNMKQNKNLKTFESKIVTHVKASPSDFCKILTNPVYYNHFKFYLPTPEQKPADPKMEAEKKKVQEETDKEFNKLAQDNFDDLSKL